MPAKKSVSKVVSPNMTKKANPSTPLPKKKEENSVVGKVVNRAKTVLREVRDLPTAKGTSMVAADEYKAKSPSTAAKLKQNINRSSKNWDQQLSEVAGAILRGERGTSSAQIGKFGEYKKGKPRK